MWFAYLHGGEQTSINFIQFYFLFISCSMIFLSFLVNCFEKYIPSFISKTFRFGKCSYKGTTSIPTIEFPKSSFKNFYELGGIFISVVYLFVFSSYIFGFNVPEFFINIFQALRGERKDVSKLSATKVFNAISLLSLQVARRYYDTHYVSIFGKNSKINLTHWGIGMTFYPMVVAAILSEAPNFSTKEIQRVQFSSIGIIDLFGILLFLWAWWHQHTCTVILANLRQKKGKTTTMDEYKIPKGDWFEYLSSPHCNAEILMYTALTIFLWKNTTWWFVILWIYCNQIECILLSHWWYKETFKNFPKNRKALIPFVY